MVTDDVAKLAGVRRGIQSDGNLLLQPVMQHLNEKKKKHATSSLPPAQLVHQYIYHMQVEVIAPQSDA